eukprot:TRINITY_DN38556_c0_g1_i1.p2 TRINITY_DN38556_c0_g1~~TRINITY_DN38556_c0_g1_i1.p2  ORF type:complete len:336 (-),score=110.53 TRINITY_DN38556_c0_g1_i1:124-1131(-)
MCIRDSSNGFCNWPHCAWVKPGGQRQASSANFTSLADPGSVGSGLTALTTLMHEAGHAAHFANIEQPSPLCSQERAPTSVAYAENQSMFLDSLVGDAAWRARYARDREERPVPWEVLQADIQATHPYQVFGLRGMLAVPYFERALYETPEEQLTSESILALAASTELSIQGGAASRPLLSVPHILSDEASCYYHGYVLAEMSVHQTRAHFLSKYGNIVDNPAVGADLREQYWKPGNSQPFLTLVNNLTGAPLSHDAWVASITVSTEAQLQAEKLEYDAALKAVVEFKETDEIDLDQHMSIVDGDVRIADTEQAGSFLQACKVFEQHVRAKMEPKL